MGASGTLLASVSGAGGPISYPLSAFQRFQLNSRAYDKFGLFKPGNGADQNEFVRLRIDNVSYTGASVPEPSSLALLALFGATTFGLRASRRPTTLCRQLRS